MISELSGGKQGNWGMCWWVERQRQERRYSAPHIWASLPLPSLAMPQFPHDETKEGAVLQFSPFVTLMEFTATVILGSRKPTPEMPPPSMGDCPAASFLGQHSVPWFTNACRSLSVLEHQSACCSPRAWSTSSASPHSTFPSSLWIMSPLCWLLPRLGVLSNQPFRRPF